MRKEVVLAIIAGISIGLVIAFGSWKLARTFKKTSNVIDLKKNTPPQNNLGLSINNLYDYDVVTTDPLLITGITTPLADVVVSTALEDFYIKATEDGSFEVPVSLPGGLSEVKITTPFYEMAEQKLKLVFSTEFDENEALVEESTSTASSNTTNIIRENIKKDIAYVGTITDISSGTIQIKSLEGDIKQMSLSENTSFINTLKKNAEIKSTDLAIGDFIVAMGFINGNKVLDTKRVLIASPFEENKFVLVSGIIELISKTKLIIRTTNGESQEITLPKTWEGPNISDLTENQKIIVTGEFKDETYSLRTIFTPVE